MEDLKKETATSTEEVEKELVEETEDAKEKTSKKKKKNALEDKIDILTEELNEFKDKYFRSLAEFDNYKKRMTEDMKKERTYASYALSDKLIDSLEIFDQALNVETDDPNFKNFLYGFKMIKDMIMSSLTAEGVTLIDTKIGDAFNPNLEHAMDTVSDESLANNSIVKVVKKGYKFKDRLLRPAMVVINTLPAENEIIEETEETKIEA